MREQPAGLRSLMLVLRKERTIVVLAVVVAVGATLAYTLTRTPRYVAKAALSFRDESQDLAALGTAAAPRLQPDQVAAAKQDEVTREPVLRRVRRRLRISLSEQQLLDIVHTNALIRPPVSSSSRRRRVVRALPPSGRMRSRWRPSGS